MESWFCIKYWGEKMPLKGFKHTLETKEKIREALLDKWRDPLSYYNSKEWKNKMCKNTTNLWKTEDYRGALKKIHSSQVYKAKQSINKSNDWKNPVIRKKYLDSHRTLEYREWARQKCIKQKVLFKGNKLEKSVQSKLLKKNIKFVSNKFINGKEVDIFIKPNICIFCDGKFWHGDPRIYKPDDIIGRGIYKCKAKDKWSKDKLITKKFIKSKYVVMRFWEKEIKDDINLVITKIIKVVGDDIE